MKKIRYLFICVFACLFFIMFSNSEVRGEYYDICNEGLVQASQRNYSDCGNNNIYLLKSDKNKSSYIVANRELVNDNKILYAGKIDGLDTFYSMQFNFYSVVYDEKNIFNNKNNVWSDLSINGVVVYSGEFEDFAIFNESKSGFINYFYNEVGTYIIRQYVRGKVYSAIRMIVVDKDDYDLSVNEISYGEVSIDSNNLLYNGSDLKFDIGGGSYGFHEKVYVEINGCEFFPYFNEELVINGEDIEDCLKKNDVNKLSLTLKNGLNNDKTFKYSFRLYTQDVYIILEDNYSKIESTSRRIVIKATPGFEGIIDEEYCLYYWSNSANDKLTYEDFMTNYQNSENKGNYTSEKGVILRNSVGTYYLYALAKDGDSTVVVRSNEYVLKKNKRVNKVILKDFIFVGGLCLAAAIPVFIYLAIRGKDTY